MINTKNKAFLGKFRDQKKLIIAIVAVLALGVFLRTYHFADWLHFELDQSRDAKVVGLALEQGIGNLPLLGPKAAGSFLRLGPIFYYYEYLSGFVFGNSPAGIAVVSLIFSCLTLPLFYLFVRRKFSQKVSLILLTLFSTSLFLVMYSRFAWNPNNLPFFILGFFYSILRAVDEGEKKRGWWLVLASVFFSFASQLHFVAFMALPVIAVAFLLIKRPKINFKFWAGAAAILIFFYTPLIVNDFKTGGENISEFQKVFIEKSTSDKEDHVLLEKIVRSTEETVLGYGIVASGYQKAELPDFRMIGNADFDIYCDKSCRENLPIGLIMSLIFIFGLIAIGTQAISRKTSDLGKDFSLLVGIWLLVVLGLFVPISYDLAPRFFLLFAPLPFILLGYIFEFFEKKNWMLLMYAAATILLLLNLNFIYLRFSELARVQTEYFDSGSDKILKERMRVTLGQQLIITDYMEKFYNQNKYPVYVNSEAFFRRALMYHLEQRNIPREDFRNTASNVYARGNYFLIYPAKDSPEKIIRKYADKYDIAEVKDFGTLRVVRLVPKPEAINAEEQVFGPEKKPTSASGVPVRCRWNEVFGKCNTDGTETDDEAAIQ